MENNIYYEGILKKVTQYTLFKNAHIFRLRTLIFLLSFLYKQKSKKKTTKVRTLNSCSQEHTEPWTKLCLRGGHRLKSLNSRVWCRWSSSKGQAAPVSAHLKTCTRRTFYIDRSVPEKDIHMIACYYQYWVEVCTYWFFTRFCHI